MPRPIFRTVLALVALAAAAGLWLGTTYRPATETGAIDRAVARYVAQTGGKETDCVAVPVQRGEGWIMVTCGTGEAVTRYRIGHDGTISDDTGPRT